MCWVGQPLLEVSLHLLPLLGRVVVDCGDDRLRPKELHKLTQLRETAVLTVWDTCVQNGITALIVVYRVRGWSLLGDQA